MSLILDTLGIEKYSVSEINYIIEKSGIEYIETGIEYNNDTYISGIIKKFPYINVITKIDTLSDIGVTLGFHSLYLGRNPDIVLVSGDLEKYRKNIEGKGIGINGLYGKITPEKLELFLDIFGSYPEYIEIPVNIYNYDKVLVDICKENNIKIIGTEPYGNKYFKEYMIDTFTRKFLLEFSLYQSDLTSLPLYNLEETGFDIEVWKNYKPNNIFQMKESMYKTMSSPIQIIKPYDSLKISDTLEITNIPVLDNNSWYSISSPESLGIKYSHKSSDSELISELREWSFPEDIEESRKLIYLRYYASSVLDKHYSIRTWRKIYKIESGILEIKLIPKNWLGILFKEYVFLIFLDQNKKPVILKLTEEEMKKLS